MLAGSAGACAYLNTFYNAEQAYAEGVRLKAGADTLNPASREAFERAAQKSALVLERHGGSGYADDALLLLGKSFLQLERHADARRTFERLIERFPDSPLALEARLGLVRSDRLAADYAAAGIALAGLEAAGGEGLDPADVLYERGLIELGLGENRAAIATLRRLLTEHPRFARRGEVGVRFADALLAGGEYDAAIEAYGAAIEETPDPLQRRRVTLKVARALALAGRDEAAVAAFGDLLERSPSDSLAALVLIERGDVRAAAGDRDAAAEDYERAAEISPGTATGSRATLHRARIVWRVQGDREAGLEILLDAFLHAPLSAWGDSARTEARSLERILHYQRIAEGREVVAGVGDPILARSTGLYRMAEEVLATERDPAAAAALFASLVEQYPSSPWIPHALLAQGLLTIQDGRRAAGEDVLRRLVARHPDHPASDSARRELGLSIPERPAAFYAESQTLASLSGALPPAEDPMVRIVDQLGRYSRGARAPAAAATVAVPDPTTPQDTAAAADQEPPVFVDPRLRPIPEP